jgi:hypothetical protein
VFDVAITQQWATKQLATLANCNYIYWVYLWKCIIIVVHPLWAHGALWWHKAHWSTSVNVYLYKQAL